MAKVCVISGSEGPRHDPYSWTEIEFTKTDGTVVLYRYGGLGYNRIWVNGEKVADHYSDGAAYELFESLTGMDPEAAEQIPELVQERYLRRQPPAMREAIQSAMDWDREMLRYAY